MTRPALKSIPLAPQPANDERLLKDVEVAPILGVSPATLRSWRSRGHGPPFTMLGKRSPRYLHSEVMAYVRKRMVYGDDE